MRALAGGRAELRTADQQIEQIERLVERGQVEQFITVAVLKDIVPGLAPVQIMTLGASPARVREILQVALDGLNQTLGKG